MGPSFDDDEHPGTADSPRTTGADPAERPLPDPVATAFPIEDILARPGEGLAPDDAPDARRILGHSRQGRPVVGWCFGRGPRTRTVSLMAGAHADEPVGPWTLRRLVRFLGAQPRDAPTLAAWRWLVVPHVNPDGEAVNAPWAEARAPARRPGDPKTRRRGFDLAAWLSGVVREPPGDDLEFGFPRSVEDDGARPEARAVAAFLDTEGPVALHGSLHSMAFALGPWFLLERQWIGRTEALRYRLRRRVRTLGYRLHDVDRGGEKGFHRIDEGFTTRPDSRAMAAHFRAHDDDATAARFRPSSMEHARSLGGDPLTLVSEMPLFLVDPATAEGERVDGDASPPLPIDLESRRRFLAWAQDVLADRGADALRRSAARLGVRPMPLDDQARLQLAYVQEALAAVVENVTE